MRGWILAGILAASTVCGTDDCAVCFVALSEQLAFEERIALADLITTVKKVTSHAPCNRAAPDCQLTYRILPNQEYARLHQDKIKPHVQHVLLQSSKLDKIDGVRTGATHFGQQLEFHFPSGALSSSIYRHLDIAYGAVYTPQRAYVLWRKPLAEIIDTLTSFSEVALFSKRGVLPW